MLFRQEIPEVLVDHRGSLADVDGGPVELWNAQNHRPPWLDLEEFLESRHHVDQLCAGARYSVVQPHGDNQRGHLRRNRKSLE